MSKSNRSKINVDQPLRAGAITADELSKSIDSGKDLTRPTTHHGFKPSAPERGSSRSRGVINDMTSPRQVVVKFSKETSGDRNRNKSEISAAGNDREFSQERYDSSLANRFDSSRNSWNNTSLESSLPSFIKRSSPSTPSKSYNPNIPINNGGNDSQGMNSSYQNMARTGYPTLGNRLNATIVSSRPTTAIQTNMVTPNRQQQSHQPQFQSPNKLLNVLNNNSLVFQSPRPQAHGHNRPQTAQSFASDHSIDFHTELEQKHANLGRHTNPTFRATTQQHDNDSTVFDNMEISDILDYLLESRDENSKNAPFVHVTPRYNIENVKRKNFYDLVILERPGHPKSGVVWVRCSASAVQQEKVLKPHQIMQLSLYGLCIDHADERGIKPPRDLLSKPNINNPLENNNSISADVPNEIIPLKQFLEEKAQFDYLRTGRFFGLFAELKVFSAWRKYARHRSTQRSRHILLTKTIFSDVELITCVRHIIAVTYDIERNIDLFFFHGYGCISVDEFLSLQIEKNNEISQELNTIINSLGNTIEEQYNCFISGEKLASQLQSVKEHHPLSNKHGTATNTGTANFNITGGTTFGTATMNTTGGGAKAAGILSSYSRPTTATTGGYATRPTTATGTFNSNSNNAADDVDWMKFRSMQRYTEEFKDKVKLIFNLAQFRIDYTIALLLEKFWLRFKQFSLGISEVTKSKIFREDCYWSIDENLFDSQSGNIKPEILMHFNSTESVTAIMDKASAAVIEANNLLSNKRGSVTVPKASSTMTTSVVTSATTAPAYAASVGGSGDTTSPTTATAGDAVEGQATANPAADVQYAPVTRKPNDKGTKVNVEYENYGSHLCIQVNLCLDRKVIQVQDFMHLNNIDKLKVMVLPSKNTLVTSMHVLCGNIGKLIENLPNLRRHPLIYDVTSNELNMRLLKIDLPENDLVETQNVNSSNYFTCLVMSPVYNCKNAYNHAIDCIKLVQNAYVEASGLDSYLFKLFEIVRKLWSISPNSLTKQLERSIVLPQVRDSIEEPDSVDDLVRSNTRDRARLQAFRSASDYLENISRVIHSIQNIKHRSGFISSFQPIIEQISNYRIIQHHLLYNRLPTAYSTRASVLYDFLRRLESSYERDTMFSSVTSRGTAEISLSTASHDSAASHASSLTAAAAAVLVPEVSVEKRAASVQTQLDVYIQLMRRLKNFESVKDSFDVEIEVTDGIYGLIETYEKNQKRLDEEENEAILLASTNAFARRNTKVFGAGGLKAQRKSSGAARATASDMRKLLKDLFDVRHTAQTSNSVISAEKLYSICIHQRELLATTMGHARSMLLSQLNSIKNDMVTRKQTLHSRIEQTSAKLTAFSMNYADRTITEVSTTFNVLGRQVSQLRTDISNAMRAQFVLLEAHDIIGAANVVLTADEVDNFPEMDVLESAYTLRAKAWQCIVDSGSIRHQLVNSRLTNNNIVDLTRQFNAVISTHVYLLQHTTDESEVLTQIAVLIQDLLPKVKLVSFLSAKSLRSRHWKWLGDYVFSCCGMALKFSGKQSEYISALDVQSSRDPVGLGNIYKLPFNELVYRGIEKHVSKVSTITAEAVIESMLEATLDSVERALRASPVETSGEWLRDSRLREKIFLELNQIINLTQLSVLVKYALKTIMIVENTSQDMCLQTFNTRIDTMRDTVQKMERFITNMSDVQNQWIYVLHFAKFSARGEIDRDSIRLFNNCTEDIKKIEMVLQQKSSNLYEAFSPSTYSSKSYNNMQIGQGVSQTEQELATDALRGNLNSVMEDSHSNIQSILDSCPRLSLISYNRVVGLVKAWMLGPQLELPFVSSCIHDMFEGVGEIYVTLHHVQRLYMCTGFKSFDCLESVTFVEPILLSQTLDEFVKAFDKQLRIVVEKSCDVFILHRITCLRALLTDTPPDVILSNIGNVYSQRICQILAMISDAHLNQTYYMINHVSFAEDVWTSLGHPTGCISIARSDIVIENTLFARSWRSSLTALVIDCKENIAKIQDLLSTNATFPKTRPKKSKALLGGILLQEISFLRIVEELLACKCLESVSELWAARYQLRFQYNRDLRVKSSPIDVVMGSVTIPYGLEYYGAYIRSIPDLALENCILKVVGSAFSSRGSVFISYDDEQNALFQAPGEYSTSCKDVACALGRLSTTLVSSDSIHSVRFFVARLVYLDAVGCVDFCSIDQSSLQCLIQCLTSFWNAIESKDLDAYLQDSLRYPLKTKFTRNDLQTERRKINITELRSNILKRKKNNTYIGITIIGMASESFYSSLSVFEHFYRSIFNAISIPHNQPINALGVLLTAEGFVYAMELQSVLQNAFSQLAKKYSNNETIHEQYTTLVQRFCTTLEIKQFVHVCSKTLSLYQLSKREITKGKIGRFKFELQVFTSILWESVLFLASGDYTLINMLRRDLFTEFVARYQNVASPEETSVFETDIGGESLTVQELVNVALIKSALKHGLTCNHVFIEKCALFWNIFANTNNNVMIVSGEAAVGKTSIRKTVLTAIRKIGLQNDIIFGDPWPITCRRAAEVIYVALKTWFDTRMAQQAYEAALAKEAEQAALLVSDSASETRSNSVSRVRSTSTAGENTRPRLNSAMSAISVSGDEYDDSRGSVRVSTTSEILATTGHLTTVAPAIQLQPLQISESNAATGGLTTGGGVRPISGHGNRGRARTVSFGVDISQNPGTPPMTPTPTSASASANTAAPSRPSSAISTALANLSRQKGNKKHGPPKATDLQVIHTSVIYHASLTAAALLGCHDSNGRWRDGILVRKIRSIDEKIVKARAAAAADSAGGKTSTLGDFSVSPTGSGFVQANKPLHVIVLNGPIGYCVEHLFAVPFYQSYGKTIPHVDTVCRNLILPTGEMHTIPNEVKIIIETNDIQHASPACLVYIPTLRVSISSEIAIRRILTVWIRSMYNWLGDFPPWIDFLDELNKLLLNTKFVEELLYCIEYSATDIPTTVIVSRLSSFLRYFEEFLRQTQELALVDANFTPLEEKDDPIGGGFDQSRARLGSAADDEYFSDSDVHNREPTELELLQYRNDRGDSMSVNNGPRDTSGVSSNIQYTYKGVMQLGARPREKLLLRARLAVIYSALWGLGGTYNATDKRRTFENQIRDTASHYLPDVDLCGDYSLYDCVFNITEPEITIALQVNPRGNSPLINEGAPIKSDQNSLYADLFHDSASNNNRLVFRTPTSRSVDFTLRLLLHTGANVLLLGDKSCGKSMMIADILNDFKRNCPTPQDMRKHVMTHLVDVVNGTKKSEGIFAAMEILRHVLGSFKSTETIHDSFASFDESWRSAGTALKALWSGDARTNCRDKTVTSTTTSLRGAPNAQTLRQWFEREFATETKSVLETARFSYGVAFIDDMHMCVNDISGQTQDLRMIQNRPEELLKGLLEGTPLFTIKRNVVVRSVITLGEHHGSMNGCYEVDRGENPIIHKESLSDIRQQSSQLDGDDYILQRMGLISAATGEYSMLSKSSFFNQIASHMNTVSLPTMLINELHVALTVGAYVAMTAVATSVEVINVLKNEISELSKFTINMCKRMISNADLQITTPLERAIRSLVIVDVSLVSRFCMSLQYGINNISNPGGLIQLYTHEWKRYFLDPLPDGTQRDRIIALLNEQLDTLDYKQWSISADWLKSVQDDFAAHKDRVWTNSSVFESIENPVSPGLDGVRTSRSSDSAESPTAVAISKAIKASENVGSASPGIPQTPDSPPVKMTGKDRKARFAPISTSFSLETGEEDSIPTIDTNGTTVVPIDSDRSSYLPVELERTGTENSLTSGSWNAELGTYNPVMSVSEITSDTTVTKILDFTTASDTSCGDIHRVLYPAAIALILRMVRILSVAGKHILLSGYFGTTRITALHLAAKICNRQLVSFDVKDSSGVVEAQPSERAVYSSNFTRFLKSMVLSAAGFQIAVPVATGDDNDQPQQQQQSVDNSIISYDVVSAQKLLVVVSDAQQLSVEDRRLLLNLVDYEDPGSLFDDQEILGMTDALRRQLLESLSKSNESIESDKNTALNRQMKVANAVSIVPVTPSPSAAASSSSMTAVQFADESVTAVPNTATPVAALRKSLISADVSSDSRSSDSTLLPHGLKTTSIDSAAGGSYPGSRKPLQSESSQPQPQSQSQSQSFAKSKPVFTSYSFQWVKKHLQDHISANLSLVIDTDIPRPMKLESATTVTSQDIQALLKKRGGAGCTKRNVNIPPGSPTNKHTLTGLAGTKYNNASTASLASGKGGKKQRLSVKERFSLSNKTNASRSTTLNQARMSNAHYYDPSAHVKVLSEQGPPGTDGTSAAPTAATNNNQLNKRAVTNAHGIFTCPLLGPMLSRRFYSLWYDIDPIDAVQGICHTMMKNEEAGNLHSQAQRYQFSQQQEMAVRDSRTSPSLLLPTKSTSYNSLYELGNNAQQQQQQQQQQILAKKGVQFSPMVLSLRTSTVGIYIPPYNTRVPLPDTPGSTTPTPKTGVSAIAAAAKMKQRAATKAERALQKLENERRQKFKSTVVLNRYNLLLLTNQNHSFLVQESLSGILYLGVFKSFQTSAELTTDQQTVVNFSIATFIEEARAMLPYVLTYPMACDTLVLTESVITHGPESIAETASDLVLHMIREGTRVLMTRKLVLQTVAKGYEEGLIVLDNTKTIDEKLSDNNRELTEILRQLGKDIDTKREELALIPITYSRTREYECELMLSNDIHSKLCEIDRTESLIEELIVNARKKIYAFSDIDWQSFALNYTAVNKPTNAHLELMRALMVVINFTPPKVIKGDKGGASSTGGKMDNESVARYGLNLLSKSVEFASNLCSVVPQTLSSNHINALRIMNLLMNASLANELDVEKNTYSQRLAWITSRINQQTEDALQQAEEAEFSNHSQLVPAPPPQEISEDIFETLLQYLILVEIHSSTFTATAEIRESVTVMESELKALQLSNEAEKAALAVGLKSEMDVINTQMHQVNDGLLRNKEKLEIVERHNQQKLIIRKGLIESRTYVQSELTQINNVLKNMIADICIAVTVMLRAGWLPEQLRQECMEQLRTILRYNEIQVSDTPFLLGCLGDRLQIRKWTSLAENSLPCDPASINVMSLVHLVPKYALVVDPDGTATTILSENCLEGYEHYVITAQKFTLQLFDSWVNNANELRNTTTGESALSIVIIDLQAGVSEDLICFLACDFASNATAGTVNTKQSSGNSAQYGQYIEKQTPQKPQPLYLAVNPSLPNGTGSGHDIGSNDETRVIYLPNKLRVCLVSTKLPVMDEFGCSKPLPNCCLKHVTIVHWSVNTQSSHIVDSRPLNPAIDKSHVSDQTVSNRLASVLCNKLSPTHLPFSSAVNQLICTLTEKLYALEQQIISAVNTWMSDSRSATTDDFVVDNLVEQAPISLSFLSDESILQLILTVIVTRRELSIEIEMNKSMLRELMSYFSCMMEVFTMSTDFIRMCGALLTSDVLTPYALSSQSLYTNFITKAIEKAESKNFLKGIPNSLCEMKRHSRALSSLQHIVKKRKQPVIVLSRSFVGNSTAGSGTSPVANPTALSSISETTAAASETRTSPLTVTQPTAVNKRRVTSIQFQHNIQHRIDHDKKRFGLMTNSRQATMSDLNFILLPLRTFFLREAVNYIQLSIRPGLEWLVKFVLTISTWSQSATVPVEELRALMYLVQQSAGQPSVRYSYFLPFKTYGDGSVSGNTMRDSAAVRITDGLRRLRSNASISAKRSFGNNMSLGGRNSKASVLAVVEDEDEDEDDDDDADGQNNSGGISRTQSRDPDGAIDSSVDAGDSGDAFVAQLPGTRSITSRVTAFRLNDSKKVNTSGKKSIRFSKMYNPRSTLTQGGGGGSNHSQNVLRWLDRGDGALDGVKINRRSARWKVSATDINSNSKDILLDGSLQVGVNTVMLDSPQCEIVWKNKLVRPTARNGDPFEIDWLRLCGVRVFGTAGIVVAAALGAMSNEEITALKRSSTNRLSFNNAARAATGMSPDKPSSASGVKHFNSPVVTSGKGTNPVQAAVQRFSMAMRPSGASMGDRISLGGHNRISTASSSGKRHSVTPAPAVNNPIKDTLTSRHSRLSFKIKTPINLSIISKAMQNKSGLVSARSSVAHRGSMMSADGPVSALETDRMTMRFSNMSNGIGSHRSSIFSQHGPSGVGGGGSRMSIFSDRHKLHAASISQAGSLIEDSASQILDYAHDDHNNVPQIEDISELITNSNAYQNILLLEQHSSLCTIFKGMTSGINRNIYDFADWKENIAQLTAVDAYKLNDSDLETLLSKIKPPVFDDATEEEKYETFNEDGLWLKGHELTILQSILLSEAIIPGSSGSISEVFFALVASYLKKAGHIVTNADEFLPDDDDDDEDGDDDDDGLSSERMSSVLGSSLLEDDGDSQAEGDEDVFDGDYPKPLTVSKAKQSNATGTSFGTLGGAGGAGIGAGAVQKPRSTFFRNILNSDTYKNPFKAFLQEGVSTINCWTKLERIVNGRSSFRGPQRYDADNVAFTLPSNVNLDSKYRLTCRDYNNWESVLLDVLTEEPDIEKFVFMRDLRDTMQGKKSSVFLTSQLSSNQMAVFSQRARDLAMHNGKHIGIINCTTYIRNNETEMKMQRAMLTELIKSVKVLQHGMSSKKVIVEMIPLNSSFGNSVLSSALIHGSHATSGQHNKNQNSNNNNGAAGDSGSGNNNANATAVQTVSVSRDNNATFNFSLPTLTKKEKETKVWYKSFPLILSAEWGNTINPNDMNNEQSTAVMRLSSGVAPLVTLADLSYTWLPRFFSPDVITKTSKTNYTIFKDTFQGLPPTVTESIGILCEELETSLLWVMNSNKSLARSRITAEIRERLRYANKFEIRATSALITIWQLVQYLRSANREESDLPGVWSSCLNPVSLWQLSRLMLKTSDLLGATWKTKQPGTGRGVVHAANASAVNSDGESQPPPVIVVSELIKQERFVKAVCLTAESFSCSGYDVYNAKYEKSAATLAKEAVTNTARRSINNSSNGGTANASGSGRRTVNAMTVQPPISNRSGDAGGIVSGAVAAAGNFGGAGFSLGGLTPKAPPKASGTVYKNPFVQAMFNASNNVAQLAAALASKPVIAAPIAPKDTLRHRKQVKKMLKQQEEMRMNYVTQLSSVDKFSGKFEGTTSNQLQNEARDKIDKEFMSCFLSFAGLYLAEVISELTTSELMYTKTHGEKNESFDGLLSMLLQARRASNKMNIKSFLDLEEGVTTAEDDFTNWPDINTSFDLTLGSLNGQDIIKCLIKWTFDGSNGGARKIKKTIDRQSLFASMKRLSQQIKKGEVKL